MLYLDPGRGYFQIIPSSATMDGVNEIRAAGNREFAHDVQSSGRNAFESTPCRGPQLTKSMHDYCCSIWDVFIDVPDIVAVHSDAAVAYWKAYASVPEFLCPTW